VGRPSKLNERIKKSLLDAVASGTTLEGACDFAGIDYSTFKRWMSKGERADGRPEYRAFRAAVKDALSVFEVAALARIQQASKQHWVAAAWLLERRFPERYGRAEARIVEPGDGKQDYRERLLRRLGRPGEEPKDGAPEEPPPEAKA